VFLVVISPTRAGAQLQPAAPGITAQAGPAYGTLAPSEIMRRVTSAGFDPLSRPVQRGAVYILLARDRQYMDVRLTVDAGSGRVLSATRLAGMRYGGSGVDGYEVSSRYGRPPVPPNTIPNVTAARTHASARMPLPRARPGDVTTGAVKDTAPVVQAEPRAAPVGSGVTSTPPSRSSIMVPIAPLE
jgi:hypothetical protein